MTLARQKGRAFEPGRGENMMSIPTSEPGSLNPKSRLPSLDGLRAISAVMVVCGHSIKVLQVGRRLPYGAGFVEGFGGIGVNVFFVISGVLITRLLLQERNRSGSIDLRAFYLRRTFRILPAYWAYAAVVAA